MRRIVLVGAVLLGCAIAVFWLLTAPERAAPEQIAGGTPNLENGRLVFFAGGCASCHAIPGQPDKLLLGGGVEIASPAGKFVTPNISTSPERGIGNWTGEQFATALLKGTSPANRHYYPAFPYTTYQRMTPDDVRDLFAFLKTLAPSDNVPASHAFPLELSPVRRAMGIWKKLNLDGLPLEPKPGESADWNRGRYIVEALGHCAECHSPRDLTGAIIASRRYAGADLPNGDNAPNITPGKGGIGDWSEDDITFFLKDGSMPDGDVAGGDMGRVIQNTSQLPEDQQHVIAVYLKSLGPIDDAP
jgi:mono/diheme cytochrome c family protein